MHFLLLLVVILLCGYVLSDEPSGFCGAQDYKFVNKDSLIIDINNVVSHQDDRNYCEQALALAKFLVLQLTAELAPHFINMLNIGLKICPEENMKCAFNTLCEYLYSSNDKGSYKLITLKVCSVDLQFRPDDWKSYYRIGNLNLDMHDMKNVEFYLKKADLLNPNSHIVFCNIYILYIFIILDSISLGKLLYITAI